MYSSLNYSVYNYVCTILVVFMCTTLVLFMCTTLVLFVCTMDAEKGWVAETGHIQLFLVFYFLAPFIYSRTSLRLPLWLALFEGHVYCLWPLPHVLFVCTTLVGVLFVATPTCTIIVYYLNNCTLL